MTVNGAEVLVKAAIQGGVRVCFANAGTTELPIVAALDSVPGIRSILGLFEGVCTGAADGYGRMADHPAMTLLHLGPGLGNGIANLHNARRARTPVVSVIGEHATWHRAADAPLTMDIESLAGTVSGWLRTAASHEALGRDATDAVSAAMLGQVATLIVPHDHQIAPCDERGPAASHFAFAPVDPGAVGAALDLLRTGHRSALILGGRALRRSGLEAAARIKAATGCDLFSETWPAHMDRGAGLPRVVRIPYFPEQAKAVLSGYDSVILAGARDPVTFFGYEGVPSFLLDERQRKAALSGDGVNEAEALDHLADALGAPRGGGALGVRAHEPKRPVLPTGDLTPEKACQVLAALQPEGAIIVEEALTSSKAYFDLSAGAARHSYLGLTGGAIGQGIPCATGAAVACPDRPVINFQADGSAMYTVQGLWTQARENLNVTTLICSNRSYRILGIELARAGQASPGPNTRSLVDLGRPTIDWAQIGRGMGVPSVTARTAEQLAFELEGALKEAGPHLIELVL